MALKHVCQNSVTNGEDEAQMLCICPRLKNLSDDYDLFIWVLNIAFNTVMVIS